MKKIALLLGLWCVQNLALASWVYFDGNYGNALVYYDPNIEVKGKSSTLKIFNMLTVQDMVPIYDAGAPKKLRMVVYSSELSTYEFNCKEETIHLKSRTFYNDVDGKFPILTYKNTDKFIEQGNSDFAKQFRKRKVFPNHDKPLKMMNLACR
jgi:hypothetical protein